MTGVVASPRQTISSGDHTMLNRNASYEQDSSHNSYQEYPSCQPFINDPYRRPAQKSVTPYPESNRQAVMSALRGLQEKIRQLEVDRTQAELNLRTLAKETTRYRDILQDEPDATNISLQSANISASARDVHAKLGSAEKRCEALEKQLDHMRHMVKTSSTDDMPCSLRQKHPLPSATTSLLERHRMESEQREMTAQLSKISELERAQMKLTATQTLAENKIRELEEKLREERHHRKLMQQKASELQAAAASSLILQETEQRPKKTKKKRKCVPPGGNTGRMSRPASNRNGSTPKQHFRLKIGDIPFIGGTSVGPSHSVPANFQEVLSLMKSHNNKLCENPCNATCRPPKPSKGAPRRRGRAPRSLNSNSNCNGDLAELLLQLQDEFGAMSFEHQELSRQIEEATDVRLRDDLERDLELLVSSMEAKGDQIARLRRHQEKLMRKQTSKKRPSSASSTVSLPPNGRVEVITTVKTSGATMQDRTAAGGSAGKTLNLLRNLRRIQTTLRKDDLSWDC
ncbi:Centrosomal protein of 57 kDa [Lamellibrachia satsuma]|nr:Centrosomal protein of 57 kDa [Lamellibrachia satsuma]